MAITSPTATTIAIIGRTKLSGMAIADTRQRKAQMIRATPNQILSFLIVVTFFCKLPCKSIIRPRPPQMITPAHASEKKPKASGTVRESIQSTAATSTISAPKSLYQIFLPIFYSFYYLKITFAERADISSPSVSIIEEKCL